MKLKLFPLLLLLITFSACSSLATKDEESLPLMDGSTLFIENGKAVKITDKAGEPLDMKIESRILELANGDIIYIRRDGSVNGLNGSSHKNSSKSDNGHSH